MNAVDHKASALQLINVQQSIVRSYEGATPEVTEVLAEAQVHATLYLAENQRIANLLAYQALHPNAHTTLDNSVADQITEAMSA